VFTGVALQSRPAGPREAVTTFRVTVGYKGVRRGQIVRVHHRSGPSASCGLRFEIGTAHPVAASRNDAGPGQTATACAIAAMRSDAGDELRRR
jgi:hypothetical protein